MLSSLLTGGSLGLAGGIAPGPLTVLVLTQTLRHGTWEGARVSLAPIITDGPLLILSATVATVLVEFDLIFGVIGVIGAVFLFWLGVESFQSRGVELDALEPPQGGVIKAILTNLLNPHPYIFWVAIGGPLIAQAWENSVGAVLAFLVGFFGALCGAKVMLAVLVGRARGFFTGRIYVWAQRCMGSVMVGFSFWFLWESLVRFGLVG